MRSEPSSDNVTASIRDSAFVAEPAYSGLGPRAKLLRSIAIVTHCVPSLAPVVAAWREHLGYELVGEGRLGESLCAAWDTPAAAGQAFALLAPASGDPALIRFIEAGEPGGYGPPLTWGWNATELLVRDPDALARRFRGSPFRVLGGPGDLYAAPKAPRAMQVRGPAGELIYFTRILPGGSRYGLKGARSEVDRFFIVTVGGPSLEALQRFYGKTLGHRIMDRMPFINTILADGCGVPRDTVFPTSVARIPGRSFLVEMDQYPATVGARRCREGHLPPGMAMVSFRIARHADVPMPWRAPPCAIDELPYAGARTGVVTGAAGEWLELLEDHE